MGVAAPKAIATLGFGFQLSHSEVGIGLIFSEATSLWWEGLQLLDVHDDAHDDDAHDDAAIIFESESRNDMLYLKGGPFLSSCGAC